MAKQEIVAMILAGGQGSRLGVLTEFIAKPAVPFGSRYRIIDFPLSNCTNSGIETVGVLTQYQPLELNSYIGNGNSWDLDRKNGGTYILPPFQSNNGNDWYKGTANAIYQNIPFIDSYDPKTVVILSGDHVYKMDYTKLVKFHYETEAAATIAVIEVPFEEASRFGIMNTNENLKIEEFEEKPEHPKNNLASMGVYCFDWKILRNELIEDEMDKKSSNDFGKNIIPRMLNKGLPLYAFKFNGYWKDVGTIKSLWEANMDLLDKPDQIDLHDANWLIYSTNPEQQSNYFGPAAEVSNVALTDGSMIYGKAFHSIVSYGAVVEEDAEILDSILMPGAVVKKGTVLHKCIVGMNTVIGENVIATPDIQDGINQFVNTRLCCDGITVFGSDIVVKDNCKINGNSMIGITEADIESDIIVGTHRKYRHC